MAVVIDGNKIAGGIREAIRAETAALKSRKDCSGTCRCAGGKRSGDRNLCEKKEQACREIGFCHENINCLKDAAEGKILELINELNRDKSIHGILVQLPLPKRVSVDSVIAAIDPHKDVDGFHPYNVGALMAGSPFFVPCTPRGIMELISRTGIAISGKEAVIVEP